MSEGMSPEKPQIGDEADAFLKSLRGNETSGSKKTHQEVRVKVDNPGQIYRTAIDWFARVKNSASPLEERPVDSVTMPLSRTEVDDAVLLRESSEMHIVEDFLTNGKGERELGMYVDTVLSFSDDVLRKPNLGLYDVSRRQQLLEMMKSVGLDAQLVDSERHSRIEVNTGKGMFVELDLGIWPKAERAAHVQEKVFNAQDGREGVSREEAFNDVLAESEVDDKANSYIEMILARDVGGSSVPGPILFRDEADFTDKLDTYAVFCGKIMGTIYQELGEKTPTQPIVFETQE
jgi:hypothetical protein